MTDCCLCVCWRPKTHRRLIADIFQSARLAKRDPKIIPSKSKIDKLASYLAIYPAQLSTVTYELNQMLAKSHRKGHIGYVILTIEVYRSILKKFTEHSIAYLLETSLNVVLHDILLIQDLFYIRSAALLIKECSKSEVFTTNLTFVWALLDLSSLIYQAEAKGPTIPFGSLELHSLDEEKTSLCFVGLTILTSLMPKISQHATWLSTFLPSIIDIVLNILSISNLTHNTMDAKHPQHPLHILEEEDLAEVFQQMPDFVTALTNANPNNLLDMAWTLLRSMAITNTTTVIEEITHCIIQTMLKYKMKFCCKLSIQVLFLVPYTFAQHNTDLDLNLFLEAHIFTILTKHLYYSISLHNQVEKVQQYHFLLDGSEAFYQHREVKLGALIDMSMWMEKHIDVIYASATYPIDHKHIMDCFQSILQILIYVFKVHPKVCNALPKQIQALVYDAMGQSPLFTQTFEAFAQTASAYMPSEDKVKEENKQKVLEKRLLRQQQRREQQAQEEAPLAIEGEEGNEQEEGVKEERKEVEEEDDVAEQIEDEQATLLLNKLLLILCKLSEKTKPFGGSIFTILTKLFEDINLVAQQHFVEYVAPSLHPQQHGMQGTSLSSLTASNTSNSPGDKKHDRDGGHAANPVKIGVVNTVRKNHLLQHYFICSHYMMSIIVSRMVIDHKAVLLTNTSPPALLSNETWNYLMNMLKSFSHFEGRRGILHLLGILLAVSQPLILQSHHHQHAGNGYHNHAAQQGGAVYELELYKQLLMPQASSSKVRQRVANYFFYPFSAHQMHALYSTMFEDVLHMKSLFGLRVMQWWNLMVSLSFHLYHSYPNNYAVYL